MPKIMRISKSIACNNGTTNASRQNVLLEATTPLGRTAIEIDLTRAHQPQEQSRLEKLFESLGYNTATINGMLDSLRKLSSNHNQKNFTLKQLQQQRMIELELPRLGQSHEVEIISLRLRRLDEGEFGHDEEFVRTNHTHNGLAAIKIVSETLGQRATEATSEFVLAPAGTLDEYVHTLSAVNKFRTHIEQLPAQTAVSVTDAAQRAMEQHMREAKQGVIVSDPTVRDHDACIHTSRGVPIRSFNKVMLGADGNLCDEPKVILDMATKHTDAFVGLTGLKAVPGKKLWETINLAIWMAVCEGVVQPLLHHKIPKQYLHNAVLQSWIQYAGKNFFGTVPRFSAGDLLRSGGLKTSDIMQLEGLFATPDANVNRGNLFLLEQKAQETVKEFLVFIEDINPDMHEIAGILNSKWDRVTYWIKRDLKSDFLPTYNAERYPKDKPHRYGNVINTETNSPSFSGHQFIPRRERLTDSMSSQIPVSGAVEYRRGDFVGNRKIADYYSRVESRNSTAIDDAWADFERYRLGLMLLK